MKATNNFSSKVVTLAVQSALLCMFTSPLLAHADDTQNAEVAALTQPANSVEVGAEYVSQGSAKFGEYNGLDQRGTYLIGNFDLRGGNAYDAANGGDGTKRFEIKGTDLGTTSREFGLDASSQGKWNLGFDYDELRHNISDTYQTPFQGNMGSNSFTLPSNFGTINTGNKTPITGGTTFTTAPGSNVLTPAQIADFNTPEVYSQRENSKFTAGYVFDSQWSMKFDFNHLQQSGAKLQGVAGDQVNGNSAGATTGFAGQTPYVLMMPTNYTTDTINFALNWVGDKGYATASYYGSMFRDGYNSVTFNNPFNNVTTGTTGNTSSSLPVDTMSTMPGNDFNQLNANGGYNFSATTKLVGGISYSLNTQNDAYASFGNLTPNGVPQSSLNGLVVSTHADVKLTDQTTKDLQLSAALKYNDRNNQTASNAYNYYTINEYPSPLSTGTNGTQQSMNAPMSNSKTQVDFGGDYRIDKIQKLNVTYSYEGIQRWCNGMNYSSNLATVATNNIAPYTATGCAEVPVSAENKIEADYKVKLSEDLNFKVGYGYAYRVAEINPLFYNPMQVTIVSGTGTSTSGAGGAGYEIPGFMSYMDASRREQLIKAGINWQANEKLSFSVNTRYTKDYYPDSTYGEQNGTSYSLNLDATYAESEHRTFSAYATTQNKSRDLTNLQALTAGTASTTKISNPANATWTNTLTENDLTLGVGAKQGGLMENKLELSGDLTYSLDKTTYDTELNYSGLTTGGLACSSPQVMTCGALPEITNDILQLKLAGIYKIDKVSKVRVGYLFQRLNSTDYLYNTYQYGSTPSTLLPTNQQASSYSVNVVSVSYAYSF